MSGHDPDDYFNNITNLYNLQPELIRFNVSLCEEASRATNNELRELIQSATVLLGSWHVHDYAEKVITQCMKILKDRSLLER